MIKANFDGEGGFYMGCMLCPRQCGADRERGEVGYCGMPAEVRVARAALHPFEEPPISGTRGSGTVFFVGCSLRCVYCQNSTIRSPDAGKPFSAMEATPAGIVTEVT